MSTTTTHPWWQRGPVQDQCRGNHTYAGGCRYNADDPRRPSYPAELRPGGRMQNTADSTPVTD